jgi:hypothetical protein
MNKYLVLGIGAAIAGYLLSYVAYHYIETRNVDTDEHNKEAIGNVHFRTALVAGLAAFVAMFIIDRNNGNGGMGVVPEQGLRVQKMDTGQPCF